MTCRHLDLNQTKWNEVSPSAILAILKCSLTLCGRSCWLRQHEYGIFPSLLGSACIAYGMLASLDRQWWLDISSWLQNLASAEPGKSWQQFKYLIFKVPPPVWGLSITFWTGFTLASLGCCSLYSFSVFLYLLINRLKRKTKALF